MKLFLKRTFVALAVIIFVIGVLLRLLHWEIASIGGYDLMIGGAALLLLAVLIRYL